MGAWEEPGSRRVGGYGPEATYLVCASFLFFFFFFPSLFWWHTEFPGQEGSDLSHSCDLRCSGNTKSLTHCSRLGIKPASQRSRDTDNPIVPQQELLCQFLIPLVLCARHHFLFFFF